MKNKVPTVTPKGALKKMNFQADKTIIGREPKAEVLANMRSSRWSGPDRRFPATPKYITRNGVPGKLVDGEWVALTRKSA